MTQIMYVCDPCADGAPEMCGHYDLAELRVLPDGTTVCQDCYDDLVLADHGVEDDAEGYKPLWATFPKPHSHAEPSDRQKSDPGRLVPPHGSGP